MRVSLAVVGYYRVFLVVQSDSDFSEDESSEESEVSEDSSGSDSEGEGKERKEKAGGSDDGSDWSDSEADDESQGEVERFNFNRVYYFTSARDKERAALLVSLLEPAVQAAVLSSHIRSV